MRFLTAVALAVVMLWVPVDGVAQAPALAMTELTNRLYEGRSCRRGSAVVDEILSRGDTLSSFFQERAGWLNCQYILEPHLEFSIQNVGPDAELIMYRVSPLIPYTVSVDLVVNKCLTLRRIQDGILLWISMVTGEIYPYDGDSAPNVCLR